MCTADRRQITVGMFTSQTINLPYRSAHPIAGNSSWDKNDGPRQNIVSDKSMAYMQDVVPAHLRLRDYHYFVGFPWQFV